MSKLIKMTPEYSKLLCSEFAEILKNTKLWDGKINYSKTFNSLERKALLNFTETAWIKMKALVSEFDKEIAWHGIATRDKVADSYTISDILVYPQEVTGATVTTDQQEYQSWLMNFDDDIFNNIRMQGHSHVNMGVTPSGVDCSLYDRILDQLDDDMFYIFMIWNKSGDKTIKIYDFKSNVLFETEDITIKVLKENIGLDEFLSGAKSLVKNKVYTMQSVKEDYDDFYGAFSVPVSYYGSCAPKKKKRKGNSK